MLLRNRTAQIAQSSATTFKAYEHLGVGALEVLRWLRANDVEFVLVGPVARAVRGDMRATGPVAIVPAPYGRNLERLTRASVRAHARLRIGPELGAGRVGDTSPIKLTAAKLIGPVRLSLRCGAHDFDIEGHPPGAPRYQELLYEAGRFQLAGDLAIEVAAPEDIEHYDHVARTGIQPEIRVIRTFDS
jgi:hypothetical protein